MGRGILLLSVLLFFVQVEAAAVFADGGGRRWLEETVERPVDDDQDVPLWTYDVVATYPHDPEAYTQGLIYHDGVLFEGTGQRGESTLRRVDLETGEVQQSVALDDEFFGEGITIVDDRIYQLTWQEHTCFVYDLETFELLDTFFYATEGWGLTFDGEHLIMSDGTNRLSFRDPETFEETRSVDVFDRDAAVTYLNELEWIEGEVWANVYQTDWIARIDPDSGETVGWIDLTGLLPGENQFEAGAGVLNGISYDAETGRIFVTGKDWPTLFEIELIPAA